MCCCCWGFKCYLVVVDDVVDDVVANNAAAPSSMVSFPAAAVDVVVSVATVVVAAAVFAVVIFKFFPKNFFKVLMKAQPKFFLGWIRLHFIVCINHDIVIGLCSELCMRLSDYTHPGYGEKVFGPKKGSYPGPLERELSTLSLDQNANY